MEIPGYFWCKERGMGIMSVTLISDRPSFTAHIRRLSKDDKELYSRDSLTGRRPGASSLQTPAEPGNERLRVDPKRFRDFEELDNVDAPLPLLILRDKRLRPVKARGQTGLSHAGTFAFLDK
jgi:hypothetical protein